MNPDLLTGHSAPITGIEISAAGTMLSASADKTVKVWDLPSRQMVASFRGETPIACCAIVRPDLFVCGEKAGAVHFLQLESPRVT
jgi:WD40 repeat protein